MKPYLLDVSVLIALAWPSHVHHLRAQEWFAHKRAAGFRTCPLTQLAFLRISSNPKFAAAAFSVGETMMLLDRITSLDEHGFWPDDQPADTALRAGQELVGHRQVTDAYLLALAASRGGILATLDRGVLALAARGAGLVEIVGEQ